MRRWYTGRTGNRGLGPNPVHQLTQALHETVTVVGEDNIGSFRVRPCRDIFLAFFWMTPDSTAALDKAIATSAYLTRCGFIYEVSKDQARARANALNAVKLDRIERQRQQAAGELRRSPPPKVTPPVVSMPPVQMSSSSGAVEKTDVRKLPPRPSRTSSKDSSSSSSSASSGSDFQGFWIIFSFSEKSRDDVNRSLAKIRRIYSRSFVKHCFRVKDDSCELGILLDSVRQARSLTASKDPFLRLLVSEVDDTDAAGSTPEVRRSALSFFRRREESVSDSESDDSWSLPKEIYINFVTNSRSFPTPDTGMTGTLIGSNPCHFTLCVSLEDATRHFSRRGRKTLRAKKLIPEVDSSSHGYDTRRIQMALVALDET